MDCLIAAVQAPPQPHRDAQVSFASHCPRPRSFVDPARVLGEPIALGDLSQRDVILHCQDDHQVLAPPGHPAMSLADG